MLADLIVIRAITMDARPTDYGTRGTIHADIESAAFDRSLGRDTAFSRRPDARKVVYSR